MARVPKIACGKIFLPRIIHCCPNMFISFARPVSLYCEEYVYVHIYISDCVQTVNELPLLPNRTAVKHNQIMKQIGAVRSVD
jgi:hypothetical protein